MNSNYYVPTNIFVLHGPTWFDNIENPYLRNFYTATANYYYHQPTSDNLGYNQALANNHYVLRDIGNPYLWDDHDYNQQPMGDFVDDVYVTNRSGFIDHHQGEANNHYASRNIGDHYFAPYNLDHNYSAFTGPDHMYNGQNSFHHIEDPYLWDDIYNQLTGEFNDGVYCHN
ncbi:hypothetical protein HAX54_022609 [Datura stramonium]|uniref:Uncharacterized protein n=1 Tax=Datura stramonium TaxID=4076 RepID=A0ABS8S467_DATST|nr:hypothetical protein [Datura stramonium]